MKQNHHNLGLSNEQVVSMYRYMVLARELDKRVWLLNRAGKVPFVISCQGHEATQVGAAFALQPGTDLLCPYYRDFGMALVFGVTPLEIMLSNFAKVGEPSSGGRQMPGHFGSKKLGIFTGSSPVTTQVPHAAGVALASKLRGESSVVLTRFGEGSSNQGDFHEGANFIGVHRLPVVLLCENNKYAISTPISKQVGGESIVARAQGYGLHGEVVDGNNILAVYETIKHAVDRARAGEGPTLVEAQTYRLVPHSSDDDDSLYRSRDEVEAAKAKDPITQIAHYVREEGLLTEDHQERLLKDIQQTVEQVTEQAEKAGYPDVDTALDHVYGS